MRAIFPHAGNSECVGCWSHSPGDWASVANATEVQFVLGSSFPKVTAPPEGFRSLESVAAAASTVLLVTEQQSGLVLDESSCREVDMKVENLVDFKTANFDSLSQGRYDMEGVSDGRKGELRTKERSDSTNFQSGSRQRPIALN